MALLRCEIAFRVDATCRLGGVRQSAPQDILALSLLLLELLIFEPLLELQRVQAACVRRRKILRATADALLQLKIQCVLLLLQLETPMLEISGVGGLREHRVQQRKRADRMKKSPMKPHENQIFRPCRKFARSRAPAMRNPRSPPLRMKRIP